MAVGRVQERRKGRCIGLCVTCNAIGSRRNVSCAFSIGILRQIRARMAGAASHSRWCRIPASERIQMECHPEERGRS